VGGYQQQSTINYDHVLCADFKKEVVTNQHGKAIGTTLTTEPRGGHTLRCNDVEAVGKETPGKHGVYKVAVKCKHPNGNSYLKTKAPGGQNTMFTKNWDKTRTMKECDAAWNSPEKVVRGDKWVSRTPSGVKVQGYIHKDYATCYPVLEQSNKQKRRMKK